MSQITSRTRAFHYTEVFLIHYAFLLFSREPIIHSLDWVAGRVLPADPRPRHQRTGTHGEEDAYFHLRKLGYVMVERNFRSPRSRGEIDLIGWDRDILCFIEVKTRTTHDVKTAEAAVDRHKRREIAQVARQYLRRCPQRLSGDSIL